MENNKKVNFKCLNCGVEYEIEINEIHKDKMGDYATCKECNATSDIDFTELEKRLKGVAEDYENIDTSDFQGILLACETLYGIHYQELFNRVAKMIIEKRLNNPQYSKEIGKEELIKQLEREFDCEIDSLNNEIKFLYE